MSTYQYRDAYFAAQDVLLRIRTHVLTWDQGGTASRASSIPSLHDDTSRIDVEFADGSKFEITVKTQSRGATDE